MFSVIFEVLPHSDQKDEYLGNAKLLKPELQAIEGFVDNVRYASLTREGWILSLSGWDTEKALIRWRTKAAHHGVQEKGRESILLNYHLRVGQITADSRIPKSHQLIEQRLDETEVGEGTTVVLLDGRCPPNWVRENGADGVAKWLGLDTAAQGLISWDVFDAVLTPGEVVLMKSFKSATAATAFLVASEPDDAARMRSVRIIRDYGKYDRREAPQYYPDANGETTLHPGE